MKLSNKKIPTEFSEVLLEFISSYVVSERRNRYVDQVVKKGYVEATKLWENGLDSRYCKLIDGPNYTSEFIENWIKDNLAGRSIYFFTFHQKSIDSQILRAEDVSNADLFDSEEHLIYDKKNGFGLWFTHEQWGYLCKK